MAEADSGVEVDSEAMVFEVAHLVVEVVIVDQVGGHLEGREPHE